MPTLQSFYPIILNVFIYLFTVNKRIILSRCEIMHMKVHAYDSWSFIDATSFIFVSVYVLYFYTSTLSWRLWYFLHAGINNVVACYNICTLECVEVGFFSHFSVYTCGRINIRASVLRWNSGRRQQIQLAITAASGNAGIIHANIRIWVFSCTIQTDEGEHFKMQHCLWTSKTTGCNMPKTSGYSRLE